MVWTTRSSSSRMERNGIRPRAAARRFARTSALLCNACRAAVRRLAAEYSKSLKVPCHSCGKMRIWRGRSGAGASEIVLEVPLVADAWLLFVAGVLSSVSMVQVESEVALLGASRPGVRGDAGACWLTAVFGWVLPALPWRRPRSTSLWRRRRRVLRRSAVRRIGFSAGRYRAAGTRRRCERRGGVVLFCDVEAVTFPIEGTVFGSEDFSTTGWQAPSSVPKAAPAKKQNKREVRRSFLLFSPFLFCACVPVYVPCA